MESTLFLSLFEIRMYFSTFFFWKITSHSVVCCVWLKFKYKSNLSLLNYSIYLIHLLLTGLLRKPQFKEQTFLEISNVWIGTSILTGFVFHWAKESGTVGTAKAAFIFISRKVKVCSKYRYYISKSLKPQGKNILFLSCRLKIGNYNIFYIYQYIYFI